jgi:Ca2+:H+ antiporter
MTPTLFPPRLEQDSAAAAAGAGVRDSQHDPAGAGARLERARSLPARLTDAQAQRRTPGGFYPNRCSVISAIHEDSHHSAPTKGHQHLSRRSAIILLLASTGLVALCAEFLISSIEEVTESSTLGEIFIGLIVLPIVGNAAEHITAITVAMKNKMDLAIGVAIGSSIQVALLITPLVVILGWALDKHMSLYFTLFETICLFGSTFIVNFLVLDGRSNYMEGALLCAVYVIIAVVAFFYPAMEDSSPLGTGEETLEFLRL